MSLRDNRFTIHILAAVAEYEAKLRTRAAMAAAIARGRKFGGRRTPDGYPYLAAARSASHRAHREKAKARTLDFARASFEDPPPPTHPNTPGTPKLGD